MYNIIVSKLLVKTFYTALLIIGFIFQSFGQNLVPNPSFEQYTDIACNPFSGDFDSMIIGWTAPTPSYPVLFSRQLDPLCFNYPFSIAQINAGWHEPKNGDIMLGISTFNERSTGICPDYSEYAQIKLKEPLIKGETYLCGFYISLGEGFDVATNNIGMHISEEQLVSDTCEYFDVKPQFNIESIITDSVGWVFASGSFQAENNGQYLTIGSFNSDEETDRIFFNNNIYLSIRLNFYFIDNVFVEPIKELIVPNVFTPNDDEYNQTFFIDNLQDDRWILTVTNRWGENVYESSYYHNEWDGQGLTSGVYYYSLKHRYVDIEYRGTITIMA